MRLQHNIMAKSAYRSYKKNVSSMKKNLEKLASGYKLNRAADDAAGLAISEKMRAQITGEETAQKNARDGISLVQTAEGALAEVHDILDRMEELATQSANGTYDNDTDRYQLQKEMGLLVEEINRIADSSNFNGIPLLDGSMDGGGDIVHSSGAFQIDDTALHPAGIDSGAVRLPPVGGELGEDTVLHTEGALGSDTNAFSIDLHNVILNANSTISIAAGDGVAITVTNYSDEAVTAKDIAAAIAGNSSKNISVDFGDANVGKSKNGNVTVTLGKNSVFEMKNSGTRVTFTQTGGDDIEMPKGVTITDSTPPPLEIEGPNVIAPSQPDTANPAKYEIDLSSVDVTAPGWVTIGVLGRKFDLEITYAEFQNRGSKPIGTVLADKLRDALEKAKLPPDTDAGALSFTSDNGKITVKFANDGETPKDYEDDLKTVDVTTAVYKNGETVQTVVDMRVGRPGGSGVQQVGSASVTIGTNTYNFKLVPENFASGYEPTDDDVVIIKQGENFEDKVMEKLNGIFARENEERRGNSEDYQEFVATSIAYDSKSGKYRLRYEYINKQYIGVTNNPGGPGSPGGPGAPEDPPVTNKNFSGDYNKSTTVLQSKSDSSPDRLASTWFELDKLAGPDGHIAEGTSITIGRNTYTFTYDTDKLGKDGYVVLNGGENPDGLDVAAEKLTKAAENNATYTVGHDGGRITITEIKDQPYFDLTTMDGIEKSLGFKIASTNPANEARGLTLQIGDTDDTYSQLKLNIKDCHPRALGIDSISIATQADAAEAVYPIRLAIDYVSDVRGTLGAAQNRLDHTINNLGVMVENVQDSESSIRDADVAEEMMAYTKNNILIQSAQSMLAQANQVPQGVLQLLQ